MLGSARCVKHAPRRFPLQRGCTDGFRISLGLPKAALCGVAAPGTAWPGFIPPWASLPAMGQPPGAKGRGNGKEGPSPYNRVLCVVRTLLGFVSSRLVSQNHLSTLVR